MDHQHDYEHDHQLGDAEPLMQQAVNPVCYHQACPVCGRNLRIRVMLLGRLVYCQHCGGGFTATAACDGPSAACYGPSERPAANRPQSAIVDELIERAAAMLGLTSGVDASGQEAE